MNKFESTLGMVGWNGAESNKEGKFIVLMVHVRSVCRIKLKRIE